MRALITGVAGQDGSYLAEQLLAEGHEVHGVVSGSPDRELANIEHLRGSIALHGDAPYGELLAQILPEELYHLAAPSFVPDSWEDVAGTLQAVAGRTAELLEALVAGRRPVRAVLAGSREMFGDAEESPQTESSRARPTTPYGVAKLAAFELTRVMRAAHGLHVSTAILYNHESPRRPVRFVTRRVTRAVAEIKLGRAECLELGSLTAVRDWSAATDMMRALRLMARADEPGDYVLASGVGRSVRELVQTAFAVAGLDPEPHLRVDARLVRSEPAHPPVGDSSLARERLGWRPRQSFEELIAEMVESDVRELSGA